jgi:hypothetical protein
MFSKLFFSTILATHIFFLQDLVMECKDKVKSRLSFPPRTHIHGTQEILRITGNLYEYFQKLTGIFKILIQNLVYYQIQLK